MIALFGQQLLYIYIYDMFKATKQFFDIAMEIRFPIFNQAPPPEQWFSSSTRSTIPQQLLAIPCCDSVDKLAQYASDGIDEGGERDLSCSEGTRIAYEHV